DAVALADLRVRRDDENVALAEQRLHRAARNLERIGVVVVDIWKHDFVPTAADREAAVVEISAGTRFGEADQGHGTLRLALFFREQRNEFVDRGAGRLQDFRDRFGRGPARTAFRRDALRFIEARGIEPGLFREPR